MGADSRVEIAILLPDVLGTYSDAGNATVLAQRLAWRGIDARVIAVTASDAPPTSCELYLLGGGEDTAQHTAAEWLGTVAGHRGDLSARSRPRAQPRAGRPPAHPRPRWTAPRPGPGAAG